VIDVDEFLVPVEGHSVPEILKKMEGFAGVSMSWVVYGWNGLEKREDGLVIERFRNHSDWNVQQNRTPKLIVNPRKVVKMDIHTADYILGESARDVKGRPVDNEYMNRPAVHEVLRVNHYWTKSAEEFELKRRKGFSCEDNPDREEAYLELIREHLESVKDVVTNDRSMDWAIPLVKAGMAKRSKMVALPP
jgi:hypothetical protein